MMSTEYGLALVASIVSITTVLSTVCGGGPIHPWDNASREYGHYGPVWGRVDGEDVIVFRWDEGQDERGGSLYVIREGGTEPTLLSPSAGDGRALSSDAIAFDTSPAISRGGTRVAYATLRHSERAGLYDIVTVGIEGSDRTQLTRSRVSQGEPAWSPDGTRIAFLQDRYLHTMAADGSDVRRIAPEIFAAHEPPVWSPDGTQLALRQVPDGALFVVTADGSESREIAPGTTGWNNRRVAWSPDSRHIAFMRGASSTDLYVVDVSEGGREKDLGGAFGPPIWSPCGTEIFVNRAEFDDGARSPGLYAISVEEPHHIRRITDLATNGIRGLAWSLDGTRLAVLMAPFAWSPSDDVVLYTVSADGSDLRVLVRQGPDGELVTESVTR